MKSRKRIAGFIIVLLVLFTAVMPVFADMSPMPQTTIVVKNPPERYYLDLLIKDDADIYDSNLTEEERNDCNADMLAVLENYDEDGWRTAFVGGTGLPLFGALTGERQDDGMAHPFGYFGVPDTYRIIIVTEDLQIYTSEIIEKRVFQETISVELREGGRITVVDSPSTAVMYLRQFVMTLLPTLLIEFLIFLLFRIPLKKNIGAFIGINIATQLLLSLVMTRTLIKSGLLAAYMLLIPMEFIILLAELLAFVFLFRDVKKSRRILFAIVSNVVSAGVGFLLIGISDTFINR